MASSASLSSPLHFHNPHPRFSPKPSTTLRPTTTATKPLFAIPPPLTAVADVDSATIAAIGGGSVAALAAALSLADPERRRRLQAEEVGGGDKEVVKDYFNKSGFERWKKIYGETDDVNRVQRDIRLGHSKTVENVMKMLTDEGKLEGVTVCDAGCGTGCLAIPLAKEGAVVTAADISAAMVAEAEKQVSFYEVKRLLLWLWVLEGNLKFDGIGPIGNVGFGGNGICLSGQESSFS
ncbi:hypothetical protein PRUPE_5G142500 [Prunus persica]|uniref:Methyltransferase domain-containing protein n=1 Tax=Prunus persica TaxID=3760 RepID=A0A251PBV2_PRUPE|nr:hypothetical protein PRUPE_5G142500 [Prunus persica]